MNKIIFLIIILSNFIIYSQNDKIDHIILEHNGNVYVGENSRIRISIMRGNDFEETLDAYIKVDKKEYISKISLKKFDEICEKLKAINPSDIIKNSPLYLDAADTKLSFKVFHNEITYSVSGLNKTDEQTDLKDFLETVNLIIDEFKIKIPFVN